LGAALLLKRDWRLGGLLLLMFICSAGFYIDYRVGDKDTMFLPAYLVWALWLGVGYQWALDWLRANYQTAYAATPRETQVLRAVIAGAVLLAMLWNWRLVDLSDDWSARTRGETILRQAKPNALILGWWHTAPVIQYLQLVEGQRPDVKVINRFLIDRDDLRRLIEAEVKRRPVYIDSPVPERLRRVEVEELDLIYYMQPQKAVAQVKGR
jgi:hypothetical protein